MYSIPLFRPASCGGRASLSFLLRKLARGLDQQEVRE